MCSHRAPGLMYLLNRAPDRGTSFEIACVVTSEDTFDEEVRVERRGIPTLVHSIRRFCEALGASVYHDFEARRAYDTETARLLEPYFADLLLLDGYLYLVTKPLLNAFRDRIINLHFSDLTVRQPDGTPRFAGIRAVRAALAAGCAETRATVHLVNEGPDDGAPIVRSWPFAVSPLVSDLQTMGALNIFGAHVHAHQHWMMQAASGPLMAAALRLIASDAVKLRDLAKARPAVARPWELDEQGSLLAPASELATMPVLAHA
jgi:folate-dependent phosphoribosylglycinamide formyltransferase PurN